MKKENNMKFLLIAITGFLFSHTAKANDSIKTLSPYTYLQVVKKYHPVAKMAAIQKEKAGSVLLGAKGAFDPLLQSSAGNKSFDGINYYQSEATQLIVPTWYGIELGAGIEYLGGTRTDPAATIGKTSFSGISIPLAKNLLMDKRRAALMQSKIMVKASDEEQRMMLNDLMLDAAEAYWQWAQAFFVYQTYSAVTELNKKRTELVITAFRLGERPAIDTIEALSQLQNFEYLQNEAWLNWQNTTQQLNAFLWTENNNPYELPAGVLPDKKVEDLFDGVIFPEKEKLIADAVAKHPELSLYNYKLQALAVERKLKFQELLPKADIKYNYLSKGFDLISATGKGLFDNNYKFGISFSVPLRLSQGRSEYKMSKLKINETSLQKNQKEITIITKIKNYYNHLVNYKTQVTLLQKTYANYLQLQRAEETRFLNGESSLFLINSRENKSLETRIKLTETAVKYNKAAFSLQWAAGQLWQY
jgi:outer membrane protein TolC